MPMRWPLPVTDPADGIFPILENSNGMDLSNPKVKTA